MTCYFPLHAWRSKTPNENGKYPLVFNRNDGFVDKPVTIPCGRCMGCRLERSRQWAIRCMHEAQLFEDNCFITLTYDDDHLPSDGSLKLAHFQKFMKRLRKKYGAGIRFFHCGEYGGETERPHYHACLFGFDFDDKKHYKTTSAGDRLYTSEKLGNLWKYGFSVIGDVTFHSAAYVARYITKKISGDSAESHYHGRSPEYCTQSKGLGKEWFKLYKDDIYPNDFVIVDGQKQRVPEYYDKLLLLDDPDLVAQLKAIRTKNAQSDPDGTDRRLDDRLICRQAKIKTLTRSMEEL